MRMPTKTRETMWTKGTSKMGSWGMKAIPKAKVKTAPTTKLARNSKMRVW
jgi:hypothetical protein